ncbi:MULTISPECIES: hypothetical protein [unclassified Phycicoccus]|uniref:hypothetical protein n=1 Tax=unclassified Phycicoccus TaxID=2637926 RepID=UPI000702EC06|nr:MULTISPECIES: hypothetical protein [unclassified Phycicoccus]KRF23937.1 hypothetical protein ASG95_04605 [Phycicoccus sp. Soil803]KRF27406.1 hypothetical protein ASG91_13275 [Phycicoccus sp. Soil802]
MSVTTPDRPADASTRAALRALPRSSGGALRLAMAVLLATDLVGGLVAVRAGVNTWGEAWGPEALLAAPVPMIVAQLLLVWLATRRLGRGAAVAAGLLATACLVSVVSGFFDGGLGNAELTAGLAAYQYVLLAVTTAVGALAIRRTVAALAR